MIPVLQPQADKKVKDEICRVLDSGWWGYGPETKALEKEFAAYVGAKYAVAVSSGTTALDLCIKGAGISRGELVTTPMTFVSDAIVGEWNGLDVTFADIDEDSLCLDPKTIHGEPRVVITVNSHGRLADIDGISKKTKALVVEDCAHAMYTPGAGSRGDLAIWSFQAVKTLPAGDGGMVTTDNEEYYERMKRLTWLGVEKSTHDRTNRRKYSWDYDILQSDGIKAYMNDLTAVIVRNQLPRLEEMTAKRRAVQARYNDAFKDIKQIKTPMYSHTVQYYTMQCKDRDGLGIYLADKGISTSVHFKPLSEMTYWKKAVKRKLPVTDRVWKKLLSLPVFYGIEWSEVEHIISTVRKFYDSSNRK